MKQSERIQDMSKHKESRNFKKSSLERIDVFHTLLKDFKIAGAAT